MAMFYRHFPSGFDEIRPTEPILDIQQGMSPIQPSRRRRTPAAPSIEPSPTWQEKQKRKAIDDILK